MPFCKRKQAHTSALLVCAILATTFLAYGKDSAKKLSAYDAIVVDPVVVAPAAAKNFPAGLDAAIRARMGEELRKKKMFPDVQDQLPPSDQKTATTGGAAAIMEPSGGPSASASGSRSGTTQPEVSKLVLSTTVEKFSKGNTAARVLVGFGAGESRIALRFVLRDAATGAEIMQFDQESSWSGDLSFTGGTANEAARGAADNAVKGLIKEIQKNR